MNFTYPAVFHPKKDGSYEGYFPDLKGCTFSGATLDDAINDAIEEERQWITVEADEDNGFPFVSDAEDIELGEGDFIREIAVIVHFEVGYY